MIDKWIPGSKEKTTKDTLAKIGITSIDELFKDIPEKARIKNWNQLSIGAGKSLTEQEISEKLDELFKEITPIDPRKTFLGGGAYLAYTPSYIPYIRQLGEILTSYTPYQAEASQGLLQALFEYQSMIAEIYELDVVNSSHYDWSTAAAEAALMALRVKKGKRKILVPDTVNPYRLEVIEAYTSPHNTKIEKVRTDPSTGRIDLEDLKTRLDNETAGVYVEAPSYIGVIDEGLKAIGEIVHDGKALYIIGMDPIAASLYKPPGRLEADIAVGDGQVLGLGLNYGGPYLGIMAIRLDMKLIRQFPGRIVGLTRDAHGRRAYTLILQTREQHIRRAKATSNITTNEALMSILAAAYIAGHGGRGLRTIAEAIRGNTLRLKKLLEKAGFKTLDSEVFREVLASLGDCPAGKLLEALYKTHGILAGPPLEPGRGPLWSKPGMALFSVTEYHRIDDLKLLASALTEASYRLCNIRGR